MSYDIKINNPNGIFADGEHDIYIDSLGQTTTISGRDKLIQDILKIIFTQTNNFYKEYSTQLQELIGTNLGIQQTINILAQRITDSLVYLQILQEEQAQYQQVQTEEIIGNINTINVDYLYEITNKDEDVRTFKVEIILEDANNQKITISKDVTVV